MARYRNRLPQLENEVFLTDGGLETSLIFHGGFDLPEFAAFHVLGTEQGRTAIRQYFREYASIARRHGVGFILESATWRASRDWGKKIGYSEAELADFNRSAIEMLVELRDELEDEESPMVVSGCLGPRGDGYRADDRMGADEAAQYHSAQIETFRDSGADMVTACTMTNVEEAIGVTLAACRAGMPVAISFTVETDGCLPSGCGLKEAVESVDAATGSAPAYFGINCAHPEHFRELFEGSSGWTSRLRGLRANASNCSHAELDEAEELDEGNPEELAGQYLELRRHWPSLTIAGGCCGTDLRHVAAIGLALCA